MKERLTFKNEPAATGLAAIAAGTPDIDIRLNGEDVGVIRFNDHMSVNDRNLGIQVVFRCKANEKELARNPNSVWKWRTIGRFAEDGKWQNARFDSGDAAREWVRNNIEKINLYREKAVSA